MIKLRVEGSKLADLIDFLSSDNSSDEETCKASVVREMDGKKVGFFVFEGFYLRTQRTVSVSAFVYQTSPTTCEIIIVGSGGATALGITWGAQKDLEKKLAEAILESVKQLDMKGDLLS